MFKTQSLTNKVAIVTGGSQGLGEAICRLQAERGATIIVTDMNEKTGNAVATEIQSTGGEAVFMSHDVSNEAGWQKVIEGANKQFGRLDILVNNAGLLKLEPFNEMSAETFNSVMAVNVRGVFLGCKTASPVMKVGGGSIINLSSIAGVVSQLPQQAAYCSSKGAVIKRSRHATD